MKALICNEFGSTKNLTLEEVKSPEPGAGQVLIDVHAAGINFPDVLTVQGKYQFKPSLPFTPGIEVSGVIKKVGKDVKMRKVGDEVISTLQTGAFASEVVTSENSTFLKGNMSFEQAAGFALTYGTSYYALKQRARLVAGETVLVLGAAGGVGVATIQLAKAMGANVIAAASNDTKLDFAEEAGADLRINYTNENLKERVKELTNGQGADVIYDPVGGDFSEQAFRAIAWNGRFLVIGFASGPIAKMPLNLALLKGASLVGVFWGSWSAREPNESQNNFSELIKMVDDKKFIPLVTEIFKLEDHASAFACIEERRAKGKVILSMK
ncbi:MAG: NADPH:quinone oxidoreductase family protein [Pseudomonadota bacterium]|jgi:NADPH2:quinone reductase|nr:NADPH:quinone oxidoreductase [Porticoccaceae bacterium]MCH2560152.1 NADPH:quinone oxidoreductase family protein [Pseudomonadales bacterium]MEC7390043.1 NADPH:quinone oxidoreductase family protein [Pseudomonadota bacterium]MAL68184.1 NADPH:quinone oxidoreductase [Porticoccaceae bacterium]MAN54352.1 NADPH:quinone oxidoreductase [Porticoccaceae bacterium]|tara:strand:- start:3845 stop:4819 length:975 start_codon:yes stop_codon:yes gene_type:complete